jgi:hypothetical protein
MMTPDQLEKIKFPIGPFMPKENISESELHGFFKTIEAAPEAYRTITKGLSENDFKKTYREGAWNIQQLVNHVADMQLLHFFRMKKALTEPDYKKITLVDIPAWAATPDCLGFPIADSLNILESITNRYVHLSKSLDDKQLEIAYYHPVRKIMLNQKQAISMNAWHVRHHIEHIKIALGTN